MLGFSLSQFHFITIGDLVLSFASLQRSLQLDQLRMALVCHKVRFVRIISRPKKFLFLDCFLRCLLKDYWHGLLILHLVEYKLDFG